MLHSNLLLSIPQVESSFCSNYDEVIRHDYLLNHLLNLFRRSMVWLDIGCDERPSHNFHLPPDLDLDQEARKLSVGSHSQILNAIISSVTVDRSLVLTFGNRHEINKREKSMQYGGSSTNAP